MSGPKIRVVVVTYSPGQTLPTFLASLAQATTVPYEVVLADNGSTDGVPQACTGPGVSLLSTGANLGYGRAANLGASDTDAPWLVIANPDLTFEPGALDAVIEAARRWPAAGCFGPAIRTPAGQLYPSARAFPTLGRGIGHALCGFWWPSNPWTRSYREETGRPQQGRTGWLSGCCLVVRTEAFRAVGGFDPTYFMYCEDMDLCHRLRAAGWDSVYVPDAVITHTGGHATMRTAATRSRMLQAHHRSLFQYLSRQYPGLGWAPVRALLAVGLLARYALASRVPRAGEGAAPNRSADVLEDRS